jgi:aspartyl/asparaginyl beta-hydroxylase (cupin superfamily)
LDKLFYEPEEVYPEIRKIHALRPYIISELNDILNETGGDSWNDWPEKKLYQNGEWKVFPFFGWGVVNEENCDKMPILSNFLRSLPNVTLASLSKMGPNTKIDIHQGFSAYSNGILRMHYTIFSESDACYLEVIDGDRRKRTYYKEDKIVIFDDSKSHYAENTSNKCRINIMIDIKRPKNVKRGVSLATNTDELEGIVQYFELKNEEYRRRI